MAVGVGFGRFGAKKNARMNSNKRTSIGRDSTPLNKHKRRQKGKEKYGYRGQGRP